MKIKLLITIIFVILFCAICYEITFDEVAYNEIQYYANEANYYENVAKQYKDSFFKLWNIHLEVLNKGGN